MQAGGKLKVANGILPNDSKQKSTSASVTQKLTNPRVLTAAAMGLTIAFAFYQAVHALQRHTVDNPFVLVVFPLLGVCAVVSLMPLLMFISFEQDFPGVNPIYPTHYFWLAKKLFKAFQENNGKVASKDL